MVCKGPDSLATLLDLTRAAPGPSPELDARIEVAMLWLEAQRGGQTDRFYARWLPGWVYEDDTEGRPALPVTSSLDAAVGLIERLLPGSIWQCGSGYGTCRASLASGTGGVEINVTRPPLGIASLALVEALLRALLVAAPQPKRAQQI